MRNSSYGERIKEPDTEDLDIKTVIHVRDLCMSLAITMF